MDQNQFLKTPLAIALAAFVVLVAAALTVTSILHNWPSGRSGTQAIFLANGQVYFGVIEKETSRLIVIRDVYYLKLPRPIFSQEDLQNQSDVSLVKLGNELHGPEDRMEITRSQVLFVEKLKTESKVVKAIENYRRAAAK